MKIESIGKSNSDICKGTKEELKMAVMARPQKQPFVVSAENAKRFSKEKTSKEHWAEIKRNAQNFDKNNLHK